MEIGAFFSWLSGWLRSDPGAAVANAASIAGFALTLYVLFSLRDLRRKFLLKARLPELLSRLADQGTKLAELMGKGGKGTSYQELSIAIGLSKQTLQRVREKLPYRKRKVVDQALIQIEAAAQTMDFNSSVVDIYTAVIVCHADLSDLSKDLAWQEQ